MDDQTYAELKRVEGGYWPAPSQSARRRPSVPAGDDWRVDAACTQHPDNFFPEPGADQELAKRACECYCTVRRQCLVYALERRERHGIWGGLSGRERDRLFKRIEGGEDMSVILSEALGDR